MQDEAEPYMEYMKHIKESGSSTAIAVKLADLRRNLHQARVDASEMVRVQSGDCFARKPRIGRLWSFA